MAVSHLKIKKECRSTTLKFYATIKVLDYFIGQVPPEMFYLFLVGAI